MPAPILDIEDLHTYFFTKEGIVKAVNGVSLTLGENSVLGLVGESGSGKTMTALSILGLVPAPGRVVKGSIRYQGRELLELDHERMRRIRGKEIALVFQDARSALNPVITVGRQVEEVMLEHTDMSQREARGNALVLLNQMGIPDPQRILGEYPFQLSGGMAQRVLLAIAIALSPRVLIADEPTSNLDVTLQAEILQRLKRQQRQQRSTMLLITHDLGVIAQMAHTVAVMYAGSIMEYAGTRELFARPTHPYTWGLLQALPRIDGADRTLRPMAGSPPQMMDPPDQCPFLARCPKATSQCRTSPHPPLEEIEEHHWAACYNPIREGWRSAPGRS